MVQAGGAAIQACAQGEINDQHGSTGFASGLWWVKDIANTNNHQLFDSARGTDANGDWQVLQTNTANFNSDYVVPAGNSVGWCWNASDAWASTDAGVEAGSLASSGYRNLDGGFSIVVYSGDPSAVQTVGHGLDAPPETIWIKASTDPGSTANWRLYWQSEGSGRYMSYNSQAEAVDNTDIWDNTAPTSGVFTIGAVGGNGQQVNNSCEYVAYCFRSISGYATITGYDGNGDTDGPFIYTGFTPQIVLQKISDDPTTTPATNGSWVLYDSTRDPNNGVNLRLNPNSDSSQGTSEAMTVDFLSNGVKIRSSDKDLNANNSRYVFAAWGASPFGGSNILPTPAALQRPQPTPTDGRAGVVSNSLRFRDSQFLDNTNLRFNNGTAATFSCWFKNANAQFFNYILGGGGSTDTGYLLVRSDSNSPALIGAFQTRSTGGTFTDYGAARFRDPSAWYHLCLQNTAGGQLTLFVNGVQVGQLTPTFGASSAIVIGNNLATNNDDNLNGYLADIYYVQQELAPTAFGNYNAEGVWVPRTEPQITASINAAGGYGDDGFKLIMNQSNITFGDTPVLQDQSGNTNDFEMNGFVLVDEDSANFDLMVDGPSTNFATWNPLASLAANVSLTDANLRVETVSSQNWSPGYLTFGPFRAGQAGKYYFEMNDDDATGVDTCNFGVTDTLNIEAPNGFWWDTGNTLSWYPENGQVYRNGTSFTFNAGRGTTGGKAMAIDFENRTVDAYSSGVLAGSLTATSSPLTSGVDYYIVAGTSNTSNTTMPFNFGQQPFRGTVPNGFTSLQCRNLPAAPITDGRTQFRAITGPGEGADGSTAGQLAGNWSENLTAVSGTLYSATPIYNLFNGNLTGVAPSIFRLTELDTSVWRFEPSEQINVVSNVSVYPYVGHTYELTVSVGGVVTTATVPSNIGGGYGTPYTVNTGPGTLDYIEYGNGYYASCLGIAVDGKVLVDLNILALAQDVFASGLWWIKNTGSNTNHQLMDTVRGQDAQGDWQAVHSNTAQVQQDYSATAGENVAWCWNASDTWNSTAGTLASSGVNNQNAGFSIVTYSGNDTAGATVAHNLGATPECIFIKNLDEPSGRDWLVYHASIPEPALQTLRLNQPNSATASGAATSAAWFDSTAPNDTLITLGDSNLTNARDNYIAYCWTSISGYSAFGSYESNNVADGPFIYLGFKPAVVIIKSSTFNSTNWITLDSTRNPFNPADSGLRPNDTAAQVSTAGTIDLLSNGFKCRGNQNSINAGTNTYVYLAFAESPFGGNNVQPANAR